MTFEERRKKIENSFKLDNKEEDKREADYSGAILKGMLIGATVLAIPKIIGGNHE